MGGELVPKREEGNHVNTKAGFLNVALTIAAFVAPRLAMADKVVCESDRERRRFCEMDTSGGVHVYRTLSKTDCIEGSNWGYSSRGVWVEGGCRAEFVSESGGYRHHDDDGRDDYHRHDDYRDDRNRPPPPPALHCPPGTHPSTHRCTKEERRNKGCRDYGGPNGTGCSNF